MGNVFIIGNGFDLDLGLPTKYSDFAASNFWPKSKTNIWKHNESSQNNSGLLSLHVTVDAPKLEEAIEKAKNRETWFDLEGELLEYSKKYDINEPNYTRFSRESTNEVKNNVDYFNKLRDSLNDYILEVQKNQFVKKDCKAGNVLKAVVENGCFENIYSFNYTDLNSIAKRTGITKEIKYTHLHGNVIERSIILGVDETELRKGYESFHKSSSRFYRSHDIYNALTTAKEIVIFGLSFGSIDYSYFDRFFKQISEGESISEDRKQYITIFTKDDGSRLSIITNLRNMGINIQRLYAQSHFQIICTSDDGEKKELTDFSKRLEENSHIYI
jgi:hypothetical protein